MLDENQVIENLCTHLRQQGYDIIQQKLTSERGVDVIALNRETGVKYLIEAKGHKSSRKGSPRYDIGFNSSQVRDRVSKGYYDVSKILAEHSNESNVKVTLACPESEIFRKYLTPIKPVLDRLKIEVFLVGESGEILIL